MLLKKRAFSAVIAADVGGVELLPHHRPRGASLHPTQHFERGGVALLLGFADVVVLARELNMDQVRKIADFIEANQIKGPNGELIRIEMFCHGALCMAVSGKCYLSLDNQGRSANRGQCMQQCRRKYRCRQRDRRWNSTSTTSTL